MPREIKIADPLAIMFRQPDGAVTVHIHPPADFGLGPYSILACDFVRHIAAAFKVDEADVWKWVDKERHRPTAKISQAN